uniref:hypothetical protein n=1 Tax=uncultured Draconibacterium sp. TaxID=1573823 RepID=UPI0032176BF5
MSKNKLCCRIFPIVILVISTLISAGLWYFEENLREFRFLTNPEELINYLGTVLFVAILPIGMFYYLGEKKKYADKAGQWALLGFLPALILLVFIIA